MTTTTGTDHVRITEHPYYTRNGLRAFAGWFIDLIFGGTGVALFWWTTIQSTMLYAQHNPLGATLAYFAPMAVMSVGFTGFYYFFASKGLSPTKLLFATQVVGNETGAPVAFWKYFLRDCVKPVYAVVFFCIMTIPLVIKAVFQQMAHQSRVDSGKYSAADLHVINKMEQQAIHQDARSTGGFFSKHPHTVFMYDKWFGTSVVTRSRKEQMAILKGKATYHTAQTDAQQAA